MKLLPIYKTELYNEIEQISNIFLYKDKTLFESVKSSNFRLFSNTFSPITPLLQFIIQKWHQSFFDWCQKKLLAKYL